MTEPPVLPGPPLPGSGLRRGIPAAVTFALIVVGWEAYVRLSGIDPITLPAPSRIVGAFLDAPGEAARQTIPTLVETLVGFTVSLVAAVGVAVVMDRLGSVRRALYPVLVATQTIPIVAIAPLVIIWFGFGLLPKVLIIVLVTFFPVVVALLDGFASTDPDGVDLLRSMGASDRAIFRKLRVPTALPSFFTGLRISITYAVVAAVFAEYVGAYEGLGIWMQLSKNSYRTDLVFVAVGITALLSIGLFVAVGAVERLVIPWHRARRASR